jgi:hypothetical protein
MASSRIQQWALTLSAYKYTIGTDLSNADGLSRLPRPVTCSHDGETGDVVLLMNHLSATTTNAAHIKQWMEKDPVLAR